MPTRKKSTRNMKPLRSFLHKAKTKNKQTGGFISLIISGLIALGVSASAAATTAAIAAPVITGALTASGALIVNKIASGKGMPSKKKSPSAAVVKQFLNKKVKQALTTGSISGGSVTRSLLRKPLVMRNTRRR